MILRRGQSSLQWLIYKAWITFCGTIELPAGIRQTFTVDNVDFFFFFFKEISASMAKRLNYSLGKEKIIADFQILP